MLEQQYSIIIWTGVLLVTLHVFKNWLTPGVRAVPGPFLAKLSNLYRLFDVSKGQNHISLLRLHQSYGDNIRLGPNVVSIRNPKDVNKVYTLKSVYVKSEFYAVQQQIANGKAAKTLFSTLDDSWHAKIKRPVANAYSLSTLRSYEPLVDRTILKLFEELDHRYETTGSACPIFEWLQYYAFDVIGEITCGEAFGFLDKGEDVGGIIEALNTTMDYNAIVGQLPWLDYCLKKNPIWMRLKQPTGAVAQFAREQLTARLKEISGAQPSEKESAKMDFVDRFLRAKETHPDVVDDKQVFSYMITNMFAGSDTTAISLRAIVYYTIKHPQVHAKLVEELDDAREAGRLSMPATWLESQNLTYFDAVVKEALRLHPAVGLILERVVPSQGLELECGTKLPAGTIVGASPWVVHRDETVFGHDSGTFRPERWLRDENEEDEAYKVRLRAMTNATMTFGKGHRSCIGKNISLLEIYKMLPSFFLRYSIKLADGCSTWNVKNSWFVRQEGVEVKLTTRW